jgi:hypothetical protein
MGPVTGTIVSRGSKLVFSQNNENRDQYLSSVTSIIMIIIITVFLRGLGRLIYPGIDALPSFVGRLYIIFMENANVTDACQILYLVLRKEHARLFNP